MNECMHAGLKRRAETTDETRPGYSKERTKGLLEHTWSVCNEKRGGGEKERVRPGGVELS